MRKLILPVCLLLFLIGGIHSPAYSQRRAKQLAKIDQKVWKAGDKGAKMFNVPDKYKDKSAVVLYQQYYYDYDNSRNYVFEEQFVRYRIKIQDQASLKEFSEFELGKEKYGLDRTTSFFLNVPSNYGKNFFNVRIIKPNKKIVKVDVEKLKVETNNKNYKLAIPNLEVGDIIDFYYYVEKVIPVADFYYVFSGKETAFKAEYPILYMDFDLYAGKNLAITFVRHKDAPSIKMLGTGKSKQKHYHFSIKDIAPRKAKRWLYPLVEYPSIKLNIVSVNKRSKIKKVPEFVPLDLSGMKQKVTKQDIIRVYKRKFYPSYLFKKSFRKYAGKKGDKKQKLITLYERLRYEYLSYFLEIQMIALSFPHIWEWEHKTTILRNEVEFIRAIIAFLEENHLSYDVLLLMERPQGDVDYLAFSNSLTPVLRINFSDGPFYLAPLDLFRTAGEINPLWEGNKSYQLVLDKKYYVVNVKDIKLPVSKSTDNVDEGTVEVKLDNDLNKVHIKALSTYKGHEKYTAQQFHLMANTVLDEDHKKFHIKPAAIRYTTGGFKVFKATSKKILDAIQTYRAKEEEKFNKDHKELIEEMFGIKIDDYHYKLISSGRFFDEPVMKFEQSYTITDKFFQKAGKNRILKLEKIMGKQTHIGDEEKDRTENVYQDYPHNYKRTYKIVIPAGYTVKGIEKLNFNVKNETGSFVSSAHMENNTLIIQVDEKHFHVFEPNQNWRQFSEIYNAAYDLSQQKLLIKKQ